jgi:hypothetical protein
MTTITEEEHYNEHAALLGHVALAWNDCHYMVLWIFRTLSGLSWSEAADSFLAQKTDHNRRGITLSRMKEVLNTRNDDLMRERGTQLLDQLGELADERNLATHTIWASVMPDREVRPHPALPRSEKLKDDFKSQFSDLTTKLRDLAGELMQYESALHVHLEITRARAQENVAALESGNGP